MKPKTVGRASGGYIPQHRTCISHVGLVAGTIVLTSDGEIPVEFLSPGDRIITRNAGMVALRAVETEKVKTDAVRINAGALGHIRPPHTVMLPAAQTVLVRDWRAKALGGASQAVLPAGCLVDDEHITSLGARQMVLVKLGFDAPYVIYADGLELSVPAMIAEEAVAAA
ncbi:MAG: Hint domain-containing protein [Pseudomonadota bacterium]